MEKTRTCEMFVDEFRIKVEARIFVYKENAPDKHIAKAILVGSFLTKYIMEFCLNLENAKFPVKIFIQKKKLVWLKSFL